MILAKVTGNVVSTCKEPKFLGKKLLMVQPINPDGTRSGEEILAVDHIGSGAGETVLVINEGSVAAELMNDPAVPLQAVIVAIVDEIELVDRRE
ncbi:MAG: EutN/CcmL family microcompartment protein [Candidatus Wallbacteria bacterium]|nr:EutN/CcmL family microcompartment protein [Candidatus Wallbacteria bacterium]